MTTELIQASDISDSAVTQLAALLPAELPTLEWTLVSSGYAKQPGGYTYCLSVESDAVKLLFSDIAVFAVDVRAYYTDGHIDIYTAPMTDAVKAWIAAKLPSWWNWDFASYVLRSHPLDANIEHGRAGRFTAQARGHVTDTEWSMLHIAKVWHFSLADVVYEPEPRLVWANRQYDCPVSLWTDGQVVLTEFYHPDTNYRGQIALTPAAARLIAIAARQRGWRDDDHWRELLMVASYETEILRRKEISFIGGGNEKRLERLTTDSGQVLYLVANEGGALGEDGETWSHYSLWVTPARAEAEYKKLEL